MTWSGLLVQPSLSICLPTDSNIYDRPAFTSYPTSTHPTPHPTVPTFLEKKGKVPLKIL